MLVNAALHAANAVLLFIVLRRMTGSRWRSAAVAALFAVHPLHVESVAWIAERKDVVSTLFFLLTLLAYHRYAVVAQFRPLGPGLPGHGLGADGQVDARHPAGRAPVAGLLAVEEGAGSGGEGAGAGNRRLDFNLIAPRSTAPCSLLPSSEKLPLLALSLATAAVTLAAQSSKGATIMLHDRAGLPVRLANAAIAYAKYLAMTVWPADLAVYYPYDFHPPFGRTTGATLLLLPEPAGPSGTSAGHRIWPSVGSGTSARSCR